jgi:FkbM family methyltransferase
MVTDTIFRALAHVPTAQRQWGRIVRHLPHRARVVRRLGQRVLIDPTEHAGYYLYYEREYDDFVFRFLGTQMPRFHQGLDLGANIGVYTVYLASRLRGVHAFEPEPEPVRWLRQNIALNQLKNVVVRRECVGRKPGVVRFQPPSRMNCGIGHVIDAAGEDRPSTSLDAFFGERGVLVPTLIKMDIEGAELLAIQGGAETLQRARARVGLLIEVHPEQVRALGGSTDELHYLLRSLGYTVHALESNGLVSLTTTEAPRFWWAENGR